MVPGTASFQVEHYLVDDQLVANASCTYMEDNELDCPLFEQDVMCIDWKNNIICIVVLHMQVYSGTSTN